MNDSSKRIIEEQKKNALARIRTDVPTLSEWYANRLFLFARKNNFLFRKRYFLKIELKFVTSRVTNFYFRYMISKTIKNMQNSDF